MDLRTQSYQPYRQKVLTKPNWLPIIFVLSSIISLLYQVTSQYLASPRFKGNMVHVIHNHLTQSRQKHSPVLLNPFPPQSLLSHQRGNKFHGRSTEQRRYDDNHSTYVILAQDKKETRMREREREREANFLSTNNLYSK